jgi:hypothetical protein
MFDGTNTVFSQLQAALQTFLINPSKLRIYLYYIASVMGRQLLQLPPITPIAFTSIRQFAGNSGNLCPLTEKVHFRHC